MMFSSLSYADRDIDPVVRTYLECRHGDIPEGDGLDSCLICKPVWTEEPTTRPAPNPILVQVREDNKRASRAKNGIELGARADMWLLSIANLDTFGGFTSWNSPGHPRHILTTASSDEVDHARRVLGRFVAVFG